MERVYLFSGFAVNLIIAVAIVRFIYYPGKQSKNYVFTFLAFNTIIYFVMSFLAKAELGVGVGFGLFAIFSVLRYRTSAISTREMTYLFILIALPVMNSTLMQDGYWGTLLGINAIIVAVLYVLERGWGFHYENSKSVKYERIELIRPESTPLLIEDLKQRTGLPVKRVEIGRINFLDDTAELKIYYGEPKTANWTDDDEAQVNGESYYLTTAND